MLEYWNSGRKNTVARRHEALGQQASCLFAECTGRMPVLPAGAPRGGVPHHSTIPTFPYSIIPGGVTGKPTARLRRHTGSAMMEFVLVMPLLFVMIMGVLQIAHIWLARQVVHYAAYCAARSTLTANHVLFQDQVVARDAAFRVCAWIAFDDEADGDVQDVTEIPGWGTIPFSKSVKKRTRVYTGYSDTEYMAMMGACPWQTRAVVEYDFALLMPVAGQMMSYLVKQAPDAVAQQIRAGEIAVKPGVGWTGQEEKKNYSYPYITLKEMCILPKPYSTAIYPISI